MNHSEPHLNDIQANGASGATEPSAAAGRVAISNVSNNCAPMPSKTSARAAREKALQEIRISLQPFANNERPTSSASSTSDSSSSPGQTSGIGSSVSSNYSAVDNKELIPRQIVALLMQNGYSEVFHSLFNFSIVYVYISTHLIHCIQYYPILHSLSYSLALVITDLNFLRYLDSKRYSDPLIAFIAFNALIAFLFICDKMC